MTTRGAHRCCNLSFFNQRALEKHQRYSPRHASIFECNSCDLSFKTPKLLDKHLCEASVHRLPVECVSCKRRFASQGTLDEHLHFVQAHGGSSTGKGCNAEAACEETKPHSPSDFVQDKPILPRSNPQYRSHGQGLQGQAKSKPVNQAPAPFRCIRCNRNFANRDALNQHLKNSSVHAKSFQCHICDNDLPNKSAFDKHSCAFTADSRRSITPTLNGSIPDEKMSHRDHLTGEIGPLAIRQPLVRCDKCQWILVSQDSLSKHKCTFRKASSDQQDSQLHDPLDASTQPKTRRAARSDSHQSAQTRTKQQDLQRNVPQIIHRAIQRPSVVRTVRGISTAKRYSTCIATRLNLLSSTSSVRSLRYTLLSSLSHRQTLFRQGPKRHSTDSSWPSKISSIVLMRRVRRSFDV